MNEPATPDAIAPDSSVCATLYIHGIGQQRFVFVYGVKKKYEFKWSDQHQKMVREYTSPATFLAEEIDIRRNTKSQYVICTLMGSPHPVTCANDAVATLIASGRSIGSPARRAALAGIVESAQAAIAAIDAPPPDEETPAPPVVVPPEQPPASSVDPTRWKDSTTGVPLDIPPVPVPGDVTRPLPLNRQHTQAELMQGGIADVREIAKKLGISLMQPTGGAKSREMLVNDILAAQRQKAA